MKKSLFAIAILSLILLSCEETDPSAPTVSIIEPVNGTLATGPILIKVEASDNEGIEKIEFHFDGVNVNTDLVEPWEYNWIPGEYVDAKDIEVQAKAYDPSGNTSVSNSVIIRVNGKVVDMDGNVYKTVKIGDQVWMAEDLRVTSFPDGSPIPLVQANSSWSMLSESDKAYCFFESDIPEDDRYDPLYTWNAATNGEGYSNTNPSNIRGISPEGWHIPSMAEWDQLVNFLGGKDSAGIKLREEGWNSLGGVPYVDATNESGFSSMPSGYRYIDGQFWDLELYAYYWSTTENCEPCYPASWWTSSRKSGFYNGGPAEPNTARAIRCVKD